MMAGPEAFIYPIRIQKVKKSNTMKNFIHIILSILFPRGPNAVDFSVLTSEEIWRDSPRARQLSVTLFPVDCHSALSYKYPRTRALIWQIKYKRDAHALRHGGFVVYKAIIEKYQSQIIILVPIPVSPARRRERGYNQCELLCEAIRKNNPPLFEIRTDILFRSTHTQRQTLKNRDERLRGAQGIFAIHKKYAAAKNGSTSEHETLKHQHLIIIDDVLTTGSTLREALLTLRKAGFANVSGMTVAH